MNVSSLATIITAVAACGAAAAALRGLRYAKSQIDTAVNDHQVDRVLALYRGFTSGEVGAARDRFSDLMFRAGEKAFGPRKCWRPELESLIPAYPAIGNDHSSSRFLGSYPKDMAGAEGNRPINAGAAVGRQHDRVLLAHPHEAEPPLPLVQAAGPRAHIALDPPVTGAMPVPRGHRRTVHARHASTLPQRAMTSAGTSAACGRVHR